MQYTLQHSKMSSNRSKPSSPLRPPLRLSAPHRQSLKKPPLLLNRTTTKLKKKSRPIPQVHKPTTFKVETDTSVLLSNNSHLKMQLDETNALSSTKIMKARHYAITHEYSYSIQNKDRMEFLIGELQQYKASIKKLESGLHQAFSRIEQFMKKDRPYPQDRPDTPYTPYKQMQAQPHTPLNGNNQLTSLEYLARENGREIQSTLVIDHQLQPHGPILCSLQNAGDMRHKQRVRDEQMIRVEPIRIIRQASERVEQIRHTPTHQVLTPSHSVKMFSRPYCRRNCADKCDCLMMI